MEIKTASKKRKLLPGLNMSHEEPYFPLILFFIE